MYCALIALSQDIQVFNLHLGIHLSLTQTSLDTYFEYLLIFLDSISAKNVVNLYVFNGSIFT